MTVLRYAFYSLASFAIATAIAFTLFGHPQLTISQTAGDVDGYLWSETIGWISMSGPGYGITIDDEGLLSGYAWSENIGWVSAEASDLAGCPSAPCEARMEETDMRGWLKALAANGNGWDGFISLSGTTPDYGPTLDELAGTFSGFAWGSDVVGWVDFQYATTNYTPCEATYQCVDLTHRDNLCTQSVNENEYCGVGNVCLAGGVCGIPGGATGDLWLAPQLVPTGNSTVANWNVVDTTSCRIFSEAGDEWYSFGDGENPVTGSQTSSPITETTLFTIECTNSLGNATSTVATVYAVVVPTWVER